MKKVLIIDDDSNVSELLKTRLESQGYETSVATDGVEGYVKAKSLKPDLIILDVSMPNLDGYSLFQEIRWDPEIKFIPVLVLTGRREVEDIFKESRIIKFMTKPFDSKELLENVAYCLNEN